MRTATLPLLLGFTLLGTAQAQAVKVRPGVAAGLSFPTGDLKRELNDHPGLILAFNLPIDFGKGRILRPRAEFQIFPVSDYATYDSAQGRWYRESRSLNSFTLGADYLHYLSGKTFRGWYLLGGAGIQGWWETKTVYDSRYWDWGREDSHNSHNRTGLAVDLGAGYQFNRSFGLELRAVHSPFEGRPDTPTGFDPDPAHRVSRQGTTLQVNASFTF